MVYLLKMGGSFHGKLLVITRGYTPWKCWNMPHWVDDLPFQEMVWNPVRKLWNDQRHFTPIFLGFPLGITIKSYNITISITILPHVSCFFFHFDGENRWWTPALISSVGKVCIHCTSLSWSQLLSSAKRRKGIPGKHWDLCSRIYPLVMTNIAMGNHHF